VLFKASLRRNSKRSKGFNCNYTFRRGTTLLAAVPGDVIIDPTVTYQTIEGFGAADASLPSLNDDIMDRFYTADRGIGLTLLRDPMHWDGTTEGDWGTMQKAVARGAKVWSSTWTPPPEWKYNQSPNGTPTETGDSELDPSHYDDWAWRFVTYVQNAADHGVPIYAVSVQNEPDFAPPWEGCIYNPQQLTDMTRSLGGAFAWANQNGYLPNPPMIIYGDVANWPGLWDYTSALEADPEALSYVARYAAHIYGGVSAPQSQARPVWMSEGETEDAFDPSMTNGLVIANAIAESLYTGYATTFHYWYLINPNDNNQGLLGNNASQDPSQWTNPTPTKRYYVMGNFSKFVRPGFVRTYVDRWPNGSLIVPFVDPATGNQVVVAVNPTNSDIQMGLYFGGTAPTWVTPYVTSDDYDLNPGGVYTVSGGRIDVDLPPRSVTTFVGSH
jgi:glucuronoarabinoxylan endo-1,4-beta-xylanase